MTRLISWNVNGIRAVMRKGFLDWLDQADPDVLCVQELKAQPDQVGLELQNPLGRYQAHFDWGERKGYSGVAMFTKKPPLHVTTGLGVERFDSEGRCVQAEFDNFTLLGIYFPNGQSAPERLQFKLEYYDAFLERIEGLRAKGQRVVACGDYNTAHYAIDLARPKANEKTSGFLPIERAWLDKLEAHGYADTLRLVNKHPGLYSYWDMKSFARERNVGWRIDYFYVSPDLVPSVLDAGIMPDVLGSDHCPITLTLAV